MPHTTQVNRLNIVNSPEQITEANYLKSKKDLEQALTTKAYDAFKALLASQPNGLSLHVELISQHYDDFIELCDLASPEYKLVLMNFSDMDLAGVDLSRLDPFFTNFTKANLTHAINLTQELLDQSTYDDAILPKGFCPTWSKAKKDVVLSQIKQLELYGKKLTEFTSKEAYDKGSKAITLAADLTRMINLSPRLNGAFQAQFLKELKRHELEFNTHRFYGIKKILQNIALCVAGLGVGYLVAGAINYYQTGNFFFFNQTTTQQKVSHIEAEVVLSEKPLILSIK